MGGVAEMPLRGHSAADLLESLRRALADDPDAIAEMIVLFKTRDGEGREYWQPGWSDLTGLGGILGALELLKTDMIRNAEADGA